MMACSGCGHHHKWGMPCNATGKKLVNRALKAEALAREAGEALRKIIAHTTDPIVIAHADGPLTKLRAAGILKETKP